MTKIESELQREELIQKGKTSPCKKVVHGGYFSFAPKTDVDSVVWKACWIITIAIVLTIIYFS